MYKIGRLGFLFLIFLMAMFYACTNDNLSDLINEQGSIVNNTTTSGSGTTVLGNNTTVSGSSATVSGSNTTITSIVSLSKSVIPIFQKYNCLTCHSSSRQDGGINLQTYSALKAVSVSGRLYGSISYASGYSAMPDGVKLRSDELSLINEWIKNGALNN